MNIVHLSNTPLSNSPSNLAQIQREAGHQAAVLLHRQSNINKLFVGGQVWTGMDSEQLAECLEAADIVHFHNFAFEQELFRHHHHLVEICRKKKCLIQYHSPRTSIENFDATINDPFFKGRRAVIAQYHVRQYPEAEHVVPNVLPIFDPRYMPLQMKPDLPPLISYAPSNVNLRGWDDKGFEATQNVLRKIERSGRANIEVIVNTPYEDTLLKKKWADIGIDEVVTGSYHLSFLEYMSMGVVGVARMDDATKAAMAEIVGENAVYTLPAGTDIDEGTLEQSLLNMLNDRSYLRQQGRYCRAWMERHWNPNTFVKYFEGIYAEL